MTNEWPAILTLTGGQKKDEELEPGGDEAADAQAGEQVRAKTRTVLPLLSPHFSSAADLSH